jgi:hypothetical protein
MRDLILRLLARFGASLLLSVLSVLARRVRK